MNEEEAKTKWCPFARIAVPLTDIATDKIVGSCSANRVGLSDRVAIAGSTDRSNPESARCIGSACMAWRWDGDKTTGDIVEERTIGAGDQYPAAPSGHRWRTGAKDTGSGDRPIALFARIGFCGLVGAP